jgi:hypothetical protein
VPDRRPAPQTVRLPPGSRSNQRSAAQLASHAPSPEPDRTAERTDALRQAISDIERRKRALIAELEAQPGGGDPGRNARRRPPIPAGHPAPVHRPGRRAPRQERRTRPARRPPGPARPARSGPARRSTAAALRLAGLPEHLQRSVRRLPAPGPLSPAPARGHHPGHHPRRQPEPHQRHRERDQAAGETEKKTETRSHVVSAPSRSAPSRSAPSSVISRDIGMTPDPRQGSGLFRLRGEREVAGVGPGGRPVGW